MNGDMTRISSRGLGSGPGDKSFGTGHPLDANMLLLHETPLIPRIIDESGGFTNLYYQGGFHHPPMFGLSTSTFGRFSVGLGKE